MAGWGQIGAAIFAGAGTGLADAAKNQDKRIDKEREKYEAQAEAARRQAEENKGRYTKQVGDFASRMKQISSVLLDVDNGIDKKTADKLAYNLVRIHGLDNNSFSNLQSLIITAKRDGGSLYTAEALQLALDPDTAFNLDDVATSLVPSYEGYDKLGPAAPSYTMPWLFGGGKPKSLDTAVRTADARGSGLMSPKDVDDSGYQKIDIAPPVTPSKYAREQAEGGGNGPSKDYNDTVEWNLKQAFNNPSKWFGSSVSETLRNLATNTGGGTVNNASQIYELQDTFFSHRKNTPVYKSKQAEGAWRGYFTELAETSGKSTLDVKRLEESYNWRAGKYGGGEILKDPEAYAKFISQSDSDFAVEYRGFDEANQNKFWRHMLQFGFLIDVDQEPDAVKDYIKILKPMARGK